MLKITSHCFSIILSNYFYIIMLIQNNFGFRIKIFGEITELIKKEMDKYIMELINDYYKDILSVNHWKYFIYETKEITINIKPYFICRDLNFFDSIKNHYEIYLNNFKDEKKKELDEKMNEKTLDWTQIKSIDIKYQKMFGILSRNKNYLNVKFDEIDIYKDNNTENDNSDKKSDFICINIDDNNIINHKVSIFSLELINFTYDFLLVFMELTENINYNNDTMKEKQIDNSLRNDLIIFMLQEIKVKLKYSKELTINNRKRNLFIL